MDPFSFAKVAIVNHKSKKCGKNLENFLKHAICAICVAPVATCFYDMSV